MVPMSSITFSSFQSWEVPRQQPLSFQFPFMIIRSWKSLEQVSSYHWWTLSLWSKKTWKSGLRVSIISSEDRVKITTTSYLVWVRGASALAIENGVGLIIPAVDIVAIPAYWRCFAVAVKFFSIIPQSTQRPEGKIEGQQSGTRPDMETARIFKYSSLLGEKCLISSRRTTEA